MLCLTAWNNKKIFNCRICPTDVFKKPHTLGFVIHIIAPWLIQIQKYSHVHKYIFVFKYDIFLLIIDDLYNIINNCTPADLNSHIQCNWRWMFRKQFLICNLDKTFQRAISALKLFTNVFIHRLQLNQI